MPEDDAAAVGGYSLAQNRDLLVHVVHPDLKLCETVCIALRMEGYQAVCFTSEALCEAEIEASPPDVAILAEAMGGMLERFRALRRGISVVMVQEQVNLDRALDAIGKGADDVVAMPIDVERVLRGIRRAIAKRSVPTPGGQGRTGRFNALTEREREVLDLLLAGRNNKEVAEILNISHRTVEVHRSKIMRKTGARNGIDLIRRAVL